MSRIDAPRFLPLRVAFAGATALGTLAVSACTPGQETHAANPSTTVTTAPRSSASGPLPPLSDIASCAGTPIDGRLVVITDGNDSIAPYGPNAVIICDLTNKGLDPNNDFPAKTLVQAGCALTEDRGQRATYADGTTASVVLPVEDSSCLAKLDPIKSPKTTQTA